MPSLYPLCRVPRSLDDVTSVRPRTEIEPRHLGLDRGAVDSIWDAVRSLWSYYARLAGPGRLRHLPAFSPSCRTARLVVAACEHRAAILAGGY